MARRKDRLPVVLDTNVVVGALLSTKRQAANQRVYRLWLHRQLQLLVSPEIAAEYLELVERLRITPARAAAFCERLQRHDIITHVNLGTRFTESRDPDDNLILATAAAGKAKFLITNDYDLLDIPATQRRRFKFEILSPKVFLTQMEAER
jgi:putative PIN family toxin of toxin-antitoxin system